MTKENATFSHYILIVELALIFICRSAAVRQASKGANILVKHFASLPLGVATLAGLDSMLLAGKKDRVAEDKVTAVLKELQGSSSHTIKNSRDIKRTSSPQLCLLTPFHASTSDVFVL